MSQFYGMAQVVARGLLLLAPRLVEGLTSEHQILQHAALLLGRRVLRLVSEVGAAVALLAGLAQVVMMQLAVHALLRATVSSGHCSS